jgi:hypothetical protein
MSGFAKSLFVVLTFLTLGVLAPAYAQQGDPGSAALAEMLKALTTPSAKGAPLGGAGSSELDQQVRGLTGSPQLTQEVYSLAGQILAELMQSSGGDMNKLFDTLERAKTDPTGFVAALSPETRDRLRELSDKLAAARR